MKVKKVFKQIYRNILKLLPTKVVANIDNLRGYHKFVNFKKPKYFGEKIQWLKINGNLEKYTNYVDKYKVREYISNTIGKDYLIPLEKIYNNPSEINFDEIPNNCVLKLNTGSGYNYIIEDKSKVNESHCKKIISKWWKEDYYKIKKESQYKNIEKKILCEKYIANKDGSLQDFKFYCFDGKIEFIEVDFDRFKNHKMNFYNTDWELLNLKKGNYGNYTEDFSKPENFEKMIEIVKKLSKPFQFVRVDLYNTDGKIYFGELTFTPASGLTPFRPIEKDIEYAKLIKITAKKEILYLGSVGIKSKRLDGVTIKSKSLLEYLKKQDINLNFIDVDNYKKRWFKIILQILIYYPKSKDIIICSSSPGASIILKFLYIIKSKKNIHYFVCGGILDKRIKAGIYPLKWYKNLKSIFVESDDMCFSLRKIGLNQTLKLVNFRNPNVIFTSPTKNSEYKFVFFGRVIEKKGVEEAIKLVTRLQKEGYNALLDIYGQATTEYEKYITNLVKDNIKIEYKGPIVPDNITEYKTLHKYDIFLFPTKFYEEGLPGALIDAYIAGLAVIGANWKYAKEYISDNKNGYIFEFDNYEDMYNKTKKLLDSKQIQEFKNESLKMSKKYKIDCLLKDFTKRIKE